MENKQDKGFTLVELLIVIVILGILATVTVFAVRGITDQGQTSACNADQQTLQVALEAYYAQNGTSADPSEADLVTAGLLVDVSANHDITPLEAAARRAALPLTTIDVYDMDVADLYETALVLVRPDGHVAWRGDEVPAHADALISRVRGSADVTLQQTAGSERPITQDLTS